MGQDEQTVPRGAREAPAAYTLGRGALFGRYVVLRPVGRGGHGEVYAAHDPVLGRTVALKLLGGGALSDVQAMARLKHPNVVTVYDAGVEDGRPFVAMELVEGTDLAGWLREEGRDRRRTLEVVLQAGRGLAAAHAAGIVHNDVKPKNVFVGKDGRVRLGDFGEAGTPAYMAPEQHRGADGDRRSDVYAFGVLLVEALTGACPFGQPGDEPSDEKGDGLVAAKTGFTPPAGLPPRSRSLVERMLAVRPEDRPTLATVLAELEALAAPRRLRWAVALAITVAALSVAAVAIVLSRPAAPATVTVAAPPPHGCEDPDTRLAGIWDDARRAMAPDGPAKVRLDGYAAGWRTMVRQTCEAAWVKGTEDAELHGRRMHCLETRLAYLEAAAGLATTAGDAAQRAAADAAQALPRIGDCADVTLLERRVPLPAGEEQRAELTRIMKAVAQARSYQGQGRFPEARTLAEATLRDARALGYKPAEAEASYLYGGLLRLTGDGTAAEAALRDAVTAAQAGRDDRLECEAWIDLVNLVGVAGGRPDEALRMAQFAEGALARLGEGHDGYRARLLAVRGTVLLEKGETDAALAGFQEALEIDAAGEPDNMLLVYDQNHIGTALVRLGRYQDALAAFERGLALAQSELGDHPMTAVLEENVGDMLSELRRDDEAAVHYRQSLDIRGRRLAKDDPALAHGRVAFAVLLERTDRNDEAIALLEEAVAGVGDRGGQSLGDAQSELCAAYFRADRVTEAAETCAHAVATLDWAEPPALVELSKALSRSGIVAEHEGRLDDALALERRAVEVGETLWGKDALPLTLDLISIGQLLVKLGKSAEAIPVFERAFALRGEAGELDSFTPWAGFNLADTLRATDLPRARRVARDALAAYRQLGDAQGTRMLEKWLKKYGK